VEVSVLLHAPSVSPSVKQYAVFIVYEIEISPRGGLDVVACVCEYTEQ